MTADGLTLPAGLDLARRLFDADIALAGADPGADGPPPLPRELAALLRAVPGRRREFAAGRDAARRAMAALGLAPAAIPVGADRAPVWPEGVTGSISHCGAACLAAVGRSDRICGIGLDIEEDTPLDPDLFDSVLTTAERARLPATGAGAIAKLIFSAKECAYKAQYPRSRTLFGFDRLDIALVPGGGRFTATFTGPVPPFAAGTRLAGRYATGGGLIVTAMTLRA